MKLFTVIIPAPTNVIPALSHVIPALSPAIPALSPAIPALYPVIPALSPVIPVETGIHNKRQDRLRTLAWRIRNQYSWIPAYARMTLWSASMTLLLALSSHAESTKTYPTHFVCIKTSEANLRAGPSKQYAIKWVIKSKGEPVLALSEFEDWVKVRDIDGDEGWLTKASVSDSNFGAIVVGNKLTVVHARPQKSSKRMVRLEEKVRVRVKKCDEKGWCNISVRDVKGWVLKSNLWGLNKSNAN